MHELRLVISRVLVRLPTWPYTPGMHADLYIRTRGCLGIAGIVHTVHTIQLYTASPSSPRLKSCAAAGCHRGHATGRDGEGGCPTCFSSIPAPCTSLACQQMVGHKKGSAHHQTPCQSAWTVRAKVPAQVDLLRARMYLPGHIVHSGTSET